jgi:hypothetical protein
MKLSNQNIYNLQECKNVWGRCQMPRGGGGGGGGCKSVPVFKSFHKDFFSCVPLLILYLFIISLAKENILQLHII